MGKIIDLTGKRYGQITVVSRAEDHICKGGLHKVAWRCVCDCGTLFTATSGNLRNGHYVSCGCMNKENIRVMCRCKTHGMTHTRLYRIWTDMKSRCKDLSNSHYGGKGVCVCKEWNDSFESFYNWAINNGYSDKLTIDRINGYGNYEPSNCRWATYKEQNFNRNFKKNRG